VVRDISHEIDYIQWLFGNIVRTSSLLGHISDLEIETEDYASIIGITEHGVSISLVMDYLSTIPVRDMLIHASGGITIECNFETGILSSTTPDHNRSNWDFSQVDRDWTYREMHRAILFAGGVNCCMLEEGLSVMRTIEMIFKNNILELSDGT
jgi:predicted dehydrogenase